MAHGVRCEQTGSGAATSAPTSKRPAPAAAERGPGAQGRRCARPRERLPRRSHNQQHETTRRRSSAKTSIFPYIFLERQSCRDPYLTIRNSRRAHLGQCLPAGPPGQLRGPLVKASSHAAGRQAGPPRGREAVGARAPAAEDEQLSPLHRNPACSSEATLQHQSGRPWSRWRPS